MNYFSTILNISKLLESENNIKILIEGYNPEAVFKNANLFIDYAEEKGIEIPEDEMEIHNRNEQQLCSVYFNCDKNNNKWRIRVADHKDNNLYQNDLTINIQSDKENKELVKSEFEKFNRYVSNVDKDKITFYNVLTNTQFAKRFILNYSTNPKWFPQFCSEYNIPLYYKDTIWFKQMLQNKCLDICSNDQKLLLKYKNTFLYNWQEGEQLKHF